MNREQRRQRERVTRLLRADIEKNGIGNFLSRLFGVDSWEYDAKEHLWIVPDNKFSGPGREYYCVRADGSFFKAHMNAEHIQ